MAAGLGSGPDRVTSQKSSASAAKGVAGVYPSKVLHIGDIVRRIQESRNLDNATLARVAGISESALKRLKSNDTNRPADKRRVVAKLASGLGSMQLPAAVRLSPAQEGLLVVLGDADIAKEEAARAFGWLDMHTVPDAPSSSALAGLVRQLESRANPAMIIDPLMFIHAMNDLPLQLFMIDPDSWLGTWDLWHLIAGKIRSDAPPRKSHVDEDHLLATTAFFFQTKRVNRFLFTPQMQVLLDRVDVIAEQHDHPFHRTWATVTSFLAPFELKDMPRTVNRSDGRTVRTRAVTFDSVAVEDGLGGTMEFALVGWEAGDEAAQSIFTEWAERRARRPVLYARDFDRSQSFHVNRWPELQSHPEWRA